MATARQGSARAAGVAGARGGGRSTRQGVPRAAEAAWRWRTGRRQLARADWRGGGHSGGAACRGETKRARRCGCTGRGCGHGRGRWSRAGRHGRIWRGGGGGSAEGPERAGAGKRTHLSLLARHESQLSCWRLRLAGRGGDVDGAEAEAEAMVKRWWRRGRWWSDGGGATVVERWRACWTSTWRGASGERRAAGGAQRTGSGYVRGAVAARAPKSSRRKWHRIGHSVSVQAPRAKCHTQHPPAYAWPVQDCLPALSAWGCCLFNTPVFRSSEGG